MINNTINVYKPSASKHECFYQVITPDQTTGDILISATNTELYSNLVISTSTSTTNWEVSKDPSVVLVPGQYNNQYFVRTAYTLSVTNTFGATPLPFTQTM